ncbi:MAG TPA: phosphoribosyl-ATP diphosphatase [Spirochaetia bacterium]|nr:phosphoribosyl-ATP diphosphatase [Spirochaetia bacterium]
MVNTEAVKPLVVRTPDGSIVDVALSNDKGFKKSIEQGRLWHIHRESGRLLPYEGGLQFSEIREGKSWYEAVIPGKEQSAGHPSNTQSVKHQWPTHETGEREMSLPDTAKTIDTPLSAELLPISSGEVLEHLAAVIRQRHVELPEGSYTTHLFTSGLDKIRKKTGEEAIELVLARERKDVVYEAADLVYHLLVLLEASEISFEEVLMELASRK